MFSHSKSLIYFFPLIIAHNCFLHQTTRFPSAHIRVLEISAKNCSLVQRTLYSLNMTFKFIKTWQYPPFFLLCRSVFPAIGGSVCWPPAEMACQPRNSGITGILSRHRWFRLLTTDRDGTPAKEFMGLRAKKGRYFALLTKKQAFQRKNVTISLFWRNNRHFSENTPHFRSFDETTGISAKKRDIFALGTKDGYQRYGKQQVMPFADQFFQL